jgi:hypothetical protein
VQITVQNVQINNTLAFILNFLGRSSYKYYKPGFL